MILQGRFLAAKFETKSSHYNGHGIFSNWYAAYSTSKTFQDKKIA